MLEQLRRGAGTWVAKVLLGLLVVSFAVWGVADVFTGYGSGALATVGKTEITPQQYEQTLRRELQRFSAQIGRNLSLDQARAFGLDRQVLSRMMGAAAIDNHAKDLNMGLSDKALAEIIRRDPGFQVNGQYSQQALEDILSRIGMSERTFLAQQRREQVRNQLTDALVSGVTPPAAMLDAVHLYQNEARVIQFFTLDPAIAGKVTDPDEAAIKAHYEANKNQFMTPQYRKVALLALTLDEVKKAIKLTDEELRKAYEATKSDYDVPEKRRVQQLGFATRDEADKAYARLSIAKDFDATAAALGAKKTDYDLGLMTRKDMIDETTAAAAFSMPLNTVSKPIEGTFNTVILRIPEIQKGKVSTFAEVKDKIRDKLAASRTSQELQKLHDLIDDQRGAGKTLKETAAKLGLTFTDIAAIDNTGKRPDGKPALSLPGADGIAKGIFTGGVGVENDVLQLPDGGYAWFDILGQTPSKQRGLDDVKADIKAIILDLERTKAIRDAARKTVERINKGEAFAAVAKSLNLPVTTTKAIKRTATEKGLSKAALTRAFALNKGAATSTATADRKSRNIVTVTEITPPAKASDAERKILGEALSRQLTGDVMAEYVSALIKRYGQSVNQAAYARVTGQDDQSGGRPRGSGF